MVDSYQKPLENHSANCYILKIIINNDRQSEDFHSKTDACITMYLEVTLQIECNLRKIGGKCLFLR